MAQGQEAGHLSLGSMDSGQSQPAAPVYQTAAECYRVLCLLGALQWPWESESNALLLAAGTWPYSAVPRSPSPEGDRCLPPADSRLHFFTLGKKKKASGYFCHQNSQEAPRRLALS